MNFLGYRERDHCDRLGAAVLMQPSAIFLLAHPASVRRFESPPPRSPQRGFATLRTHPGWQVLQDNHIAFAAICERRRPAL